MRSLSVSGLQQDGLFSRNRRICRHSKRIILTFKRTFWPFCSMFGLIPRAAKSPISTQASHYCTNMRNIRKWRKRMKRRSSCGGYRNKVRWNGSAMKNDKLWFVLHIKKKNPTSSVSFSSWTQWTHRTCLPVTLLLSTALIHPLWNMLCYLLYQCPFIRLHPGDWWWNK